MGVYNSNRYAGFTGNLNLGAGCYLTAPAGINGVFNTTGNTFFVNGFTGDDANSGADPAHPFLTIAYAVSKCSNDRDDYIFVLDCWNQDTCPIVIDKSRVHIIGVSNATMVPFPYAVITGAGVDTVFRLGANYIEIAGFAMGSSGHACIDLTASFGGHWIHHNTFGLSVACQDGIYSAVADCPSFSTIENNMFDQSITRDGIRVLGPTRCIIRNNIFREIVGGIGVHVTGPSTAEATAIIGNYFYAPIASALSAGWAITIGSSGAIIMGNRASQAGNNAGNSPYVDSTGAGVATRLNGWSDNWIADAAANPS